MQKLFFEDAWDHTIGQQDREEIIKQFQLIQGKDEIHLSFLWAASNHKKELLVTVLIHNPKTEPLQLTQTAIAYEQENKIVQTALFTVPLPLPAETSMPWTFIFSNHNRTDQPPTYSITA